MFFTQLHPNSPELLCLVMFLPAVLCKKHSRVLCFAIAVEGDRMREHGRIKVKVGGKHEEMEQDATVVQGWEVEKD